MKKILSLLEQKVEWVVLAAGVLFAAWATWFYIIDTKIKVEVGSTTLGLGDIDQHIADNAATELEGKIRATGVRVDVKPPSFVEDFRKTMNHAKATTQPAGTAMALWPQTPPIRFSDMPLSPMNPGIAATPGDPAAVLNGAGTVVKLPNAPTPQIIASRTDMSFVALPGQAAAEAGVPVSGMDKTWVSVLYTIDALALSKQWEQSRLPTANSTTAFVQVSLERQELKPDGTWADPTPLPPVAVGVEMPAVPPGPRANPDAIGYLAWASQHQSDILRPPFYTILKGKKWAPPGVDAGAQQQQEEKFDATKYMDPKSDVSKLSMEQRRMVQAARNKSAAEAAKGRARAGPRPGGGAPGAEVAPPADQAVIDPDRPASYVAADPENPGAPEMPASRTPVARMGSGAPSMAQLAATPIPANDFDPAKWAEERPGQNLVVGWAHDDTAQPGRTYRYRVTYRLKNPVLFAPSAVKNPRLAEQFDIRSDPSEWSPSIEVRTAVNFWLSRASDTSGTAAIEVYRWQGGEVKRKIFNLNAGDAIGAKEGPTDYSTGWTLVDLRRDLRTDKSYVLIMDPNGALQRRDVDTDAADPKYQEFKQQVSAPSAAATPAAR